MVYRQVDTIHPVLHPALFLQLFESIQQLVGTVRDEMDKPKQACA